MILGIFRYLLLGGQSPLVTSLGWICSVWHRGLFVESAWWRMISDRGEYLFFAFLRLASDGVLNRGGCPFGEGAE